MLATKNDIAQAYNAIASTATQKGAALQRSNVCHAIFDDLKHLYPTFTGYIDALNLGLSGGLPFTFLGDIHNKKVADLGCGAGLDVCIMQSQVGTNGSVTGYDLSNELVAYGNAIIAQHHINNATLINADIEQIPCDANFFDAITSNGVISLLPNKQAFFNEVYRVAQPGAVCCFADIVQSNTSNSSLNNVINELTGCMNGICEPNEYLHYLVNSGFKHSIIVQKRPILLNITNHNSNQKQPLPSLHIITIRTIK